MFTVDAVQQEKSNGKEQCLLTVVTVTCVVIPQTKCLWPILPLDIRLFCEMQFWCGGRCWCDVARCSLVVLSILSTNTYIEQIDYIRFRLGAGRFDPNINHKLNYLTSWNETQQSTIFLQNHFLHVYRGSSPKLAWYFPPAVSFFIGLPLRCVCWCGGCCWCDVTHCSLVVLSILLQCVFSVLLVHFQHIFFCTVALLVRANRPSSLCAKPAINCEMLMSL